MDEVGLLCRWRFLGGAAEGGAGRLAGAGLARALGVHPLVGLLLSRRGVTDAEGAGRFLGPKLTELHEPGLLPGVSAAAERLERAVRGGQPIVIYGDYDVDGVAASAILFHVLTLAGGQVSTYIPHRVDEGYGLNGEAIRQIAAEAARPPLIVTVDCGVTALAEAQAARQCGAELIITDHHEFDSRGLPEAEVLVHPRLGAVADGWSIPRRFADSASGLGGDGDKALSEIANPQSEIRNPKSPSPTPYPFEHLCGAGVAFKLAWAFATLHCGSQRLPADFRDLLLDLVSVAALGTVADVVPLVDENRVITHFGLGQIKRTRFVGLNALIDRTGLRNEKIDAFHVGFVLGPRLNACGRMGHARDALRLLTTTDAAEAGELAGRLTRVNEDRRATEKAITDEATAMVRDAGYDGDDCRAIVVGAEGWHRGVVGIVASRLVDQFARPAVVLSYDNGVAAGSARSVAGVSIHEALECCAEHLDSFGGHAMAAGLRLRRERVEPFRDDLVAAVNARLGADELVPVLEVDAECGFDELTLDLVGQLHRLAPFGRDNPSPVLCVRGVQLAESGRRIGSGGQHLRLNLRQGRKLLQAVGWRLGDLAEQLPGGVCVDVAFEPKVNVFNGTRRVDMHVKDVRLAKYVGG